MVIQRGKRKVFKGKVVRDKMQKTIIVEVERKYRHPIYKKVVREKKKYKVHNPEDMAHVGDSVKIMETRPLSKEKHWRLAMIIEKAKGIEDIKEDIKTEEQKNEKTNKTP